LISHFEGFSPYNLINPKSLWVGSEYIDLDRKDAASQWAQLKKDNPHGFDVVVEATGVQSIVDDSINYVRRGGTLCVFESPPTYSLLWFVPTLISELVNLFPCRLVYGVYDNAARVNWSPTKIFSDEINIIGSFSQT
jgi:D-arabinitol dehydrogenase (NADP+)